MQLTVTHGRNLLPVGSLDHAFRPKALAAPGADDDIGLTFDDHARVADDAAVCVLPPRQFGKAVYATGQFDQLGYPKNRRDWWIVPFLEIDSWLSAARTASRCFNNRSINACAESTAWTSAPSV